MEGGLSEFVDLFAWDANSDKILLEGGLQPALVCA